MEGGGEIDFSALANAFPEVPDRGVTARDVSTLTRGKNGKTAAAVAALVEACRDSDAKHPPAVAAWRLAHQPPSAATVESVRAVLYPPRDGSTCCCGGDLEDHSAPGAGWYGKRCGACGRTYSRDALRTVEEQNG
jgi:hypothetical protein